VDAEDRFNALYRAYSGAVLRYASRRTDPDTARDVVAETFLVAWRKLDDVPADADQAEPWLYGVARRVLANAERSSRRAQRVAARLWQEGQESQLGGESDPAVVISERHRVIQALTKLTEPDQEALRLVGWEGLDVTGAALAMGCSRTAMAVRLHRARQRLDQALRAADGSEPRLVRSAAATAPAPSTARVSMSDGGSR
jgi:RNA polymerase sigma factor (sigma-70 family)